MDEIHLHVAHGLSFREECRQLKDVFFVPLFHLIDKDQFMPRLLCLTATMPIDYYEGLEYLTATDFRANQESIQRGDYEDFLQMNISMKQIIVTKNDFVKVGLSFVAKKHLSDYPGCNVVIFCNSRAKSVHYASELERKLNEIGNETDVIVIHGGLNKHKKFWRMRFFCGIDVEYVNETCFSVLVSTNASNVGIDHRLINLVIRFELPRDLMTYLQERGRAGRLGTLALCILYATIKSYANIIRQIYSSNQQEDERDASIEELELRGMGSAISPLAQSARRELEQRRQATVRRANPYALSLEMKRKLKKRQHQELRDVLRFFFLN
jgi:superfamily II DNA helicase RecQ